MSKENPINQSGKVVPSQSQPVAAVPKPTEKTAVPPVAAVAQSKQQVASVAPQPQQPVTLPSPPMFPIYIPQKEVQAAKKIHGAYQKYAENRKIEQEKAKKAFAMRLTDDTNPAPKAPPEPSLESLLNTPTKDVMAFLNSATVKPGSKEKTSAELDDIRRFNQTHAAKTPPSSPALSPIDMKHLEQALLNPHKSRSDMLRETYIAGLLQGENQVLNDKGKKAVDDFINSPRGKGMLGDVENRGDMERVAKEALKAAKKVSGIQSVPKEPNHPYHGKSSGRSF